MITKEYHTHTYRCKHAEGDVSDYCEAAISKGLTVLGISDHVPLPDKRWDGIRMDMSELSGYCRAVDAARESYPKLRILKGMECEYDKKYASYYRDELLGRLNFDYLIGSVHFFPCREGWRDAFREIKDSNDLRLYARQFIATMQSGLFAFMAHPDLFAMGYLEWDSQSKECSAEMLEAAASLDMPLEINAGGLRRPLIVTPEGRRAGFPLTPFWEMAAEYGIRVIINSDAHRPSDIAGKTDEAYLLAKNCGLAFAELNIEK
ncbi:MAG: hypothetical protein BWK80_02610 [Desulfobacteraceae bacterium IS3]|nr:MAG: hypothetical protein BWK80_02610 [Desulfobacteraceae bacterium IS3]